MEKKIKYQLEDSWDKTYEYMLTEIEDDFYIQFDYEDSEVDLVYDEGTNVPYGSIMVCYEPAGYCYDSHSDPEIKFLYDGDEVSKEEFLDELLKQLEITKEDFEEVLGEMKKEADDKFVDYVNDNIDEFVDDRSYDGPDPDDYFDWKY